MSGIAWASFLPAAVVVSLVPGANQILSIQHGARYGRRSALVGLVGRFSAFLVHAALVAAGLSALLVRSAPLFELLRWLGVVYLVWLAVVSWRSTGEVPEATVSPPARRPLRREFWTALGNPKALVLFAVFVPQFVRDPDAPHLLVASVAYIGVEACTATLYILLGERLSAFLSHAAARRRLDRAAGVGFLGLAGWLALERRP